MKLHLIFPLVWAAISNLVADEPPTPKLTLSIESISPDGRIQVGIHNKSVDDIRVWTSCYSWAYFNWRVIDVRNGETRLYCPNPVEVFTMNFPDYAAVGPGKMITENLKLGGDDTWLNDTRPLMHWVGPRDTQPLIQSGDKIIVIYDVRDSKESNELHVWTGITEVSKDYKGGKPN